MCDGPIETVEYIWMNIWCMVEWVLSQNCRNTLILHTIDQLSKECKNVDVLVPNQLLAAIADAITYQVKE